MKQLNRLGLFFLILFLIMIHYVKAGMFIKNIFWIGIFILGIFLFLIEWNE